MIASQWLLCSIVDVRSKMVFFFEMIKDQDVNGNIKVNVDVAWNYNFDGFHHYDVSVFTTSLCGLRYVDSLSCSWVGVVRLCKTVLRVVMITAYVGFGNGVANGVADRIVSCEKIKGVSFLLLSSNRSGCRWCDT